MNSLKIILSNPRYFAPAWVFASLNIMIGTWVLYLPHVKEKFDLTDGQVGRALFCIALGLLMAIPFVPWVNKKLGLGQSTRLGIALFCAAYIIPMAAPSYLSLCASLLIVGIFSAFTDISMNALVSNIEQSSGVNFMSAAHGFFSLGGFIGAAVGSILMTWLGSPLWHVAIIAGVVILINLAISSHYADIDEMPEEKKEMGFSVSIIMPLLALAILAFIVMFNEGAVEHWSNIFMHDMVGLAENRAGLGFMAFSLCMTIGRFMGDEISSRAGSISLITGGSIVAILGHLAIMSANLYLSSIGFGILGFGLSVIVPEIYRLAGNTKDVAASVAISFVSGIGFLGFLVGPLSLGLIADSSSLVWSFGFLGGLLVMGMVIIRFNL